MSAASLRARTQSRLVLILPAAAATALQLGCAAGASAAAQSRAALSRAVAMAAPSAAVHATPAQVAQLLFIGADVGRLSQVPSGTERLVEEKVLQELYIESPGLAPATAVQDIQALQRSIRSPPSAACSTWSRTRSGSASAVPTRTRSSSRGSRASRSRSPTSRTTPRAPFTSSTPSSRT